MPHAPAGRPAGASRTLNVHLSHSADWHQVCCRMCQCLSSHLWAADQQCDPAEQPDSPCSLQLSSDQCAHEAAINQSSGRPQAREACRPDRGGARSAGTRPRAWMDPCPRAAAAGTHAGSEGCRIEHLSAGTRVRRAAQVRAGPSLPSRTQACKWIELRHGDCCIPAGLIQVLL